MRTSARKALIVGIDHYDDLRALHGCVNDAHAVKSAIERNSDGTANFSGPRLLTATGPANPVDRDRLKEAARELFRDESEIALFYFAGHGYLEDTGGFLCTSDARQGDDGLSLTELMTLANGSPATNRVIILDSCHSGAVAAGALGAPPADIRDGVTILAGSTAQQYTVEQGGSGVFTSLLVDALSGSAANLVGDVTPGSVYAHIDQSLGPWEQRPVFKTNVKNFVSLRRAEPPIPLSELLQLATIFPDPGEILQLDPTYEPTRFQEQRDDGIPEPDPAHTAVFKILQHYTAVNLVRPVDATAMYFAAMNSTGCELTVLGEHYWRLVNRNMLS